MFSDPTQLVTLGHAGTFRIRNLGKKALDEILNWDTLRQQRNGNAKYGKYDRCIMARSKSKRWVAVALARRNDNKVSPIVQQ